MERNTSKTLRRSEYIDTAIFYDLGLDNNYYPDVKFYQSIISIYQPKSILELGCGTGRVSIQLKSNKLKQITCIDLSDQMLDIFRGKLQSYPKEHQEKFKILQMNMIDFDLNNKFNCILIPFRSFQCVTNIKDIKNCIQNLKEHLTINGILIINIFIPLENMKELEGLTEQKVLIKGKSKIYKTVTNDKIDTINQVQNYSVKYHKEKSNQYVSESFKLKYYYPSEFLNLLKSNGLKIVESYNGFDLKRELPNSTNDFTVICQKH